MTSVSSAFTLLIDTSLCLDCDCHESECLCEYNIPISDSDVHLDVTATQLLPVVAVIRSLSTEDQPHPTELLARTERAELVRTVVQSVCGAVCGAYLAAVHIAAMLYMVS